MNKISFKTQESQDEPIDNGKKLKSRSTKPDFWDKHPRFPLFFSIITLLVVLARDILS
jgi:hypothetical protein